MIGARSSAWTGMFVAAAALAAGCASLERIDRAVRSPREFFCAAPKRDRRATSASANAGSKWRLPQSLGPPVTRRGHRAPRAAHSARARQSARQAPLGRNPPDRDARVRVTCHASSGGGCSPEERRSPVPFRPVPTRPASATRPPTSISWPPGSIPRTRSTRSAIAPRPLRMARCSRRSFPRLARRSRRVRPRSANAFPSRLTRRCLPVLAVARLQEDCSPAACRAAPGGVPLSVLQPIVSFLLVRLSLISAGAARQRRNRCMPVIPRRWETTIRRLQSPGSAPAAAIAGGRSASAR